MIYFDRDTRRKLLPRFLQHMDRDSIIFLGHAERFSECSNAILTKIGDTAYQKTNSLHC
jgi:chemotaxis methyl-accepting protein methylase